MEVILGVGGLAMIGTGAYMRAGRKNKGSTPTLLIIFGIVAFVASFGTLLMGRRNAPQPSAPVPVGVRNAVQKVNTYLKENNFARAMVAVPMAGPPRVVVNPT